MEEQDLQGAVHLVDEAPGELAAGGVAVITDQLAETAVQDILHLGRFRDLRGREESAATSGWLEGAKVGWPIAPWVSGRDTGDPSGAILFISSARCRATLLESSECREGSAY